MRLVGHGGGSWIGRGSEEPIAGRLRTLARLSGWPIMFAMGNLLPTTPVQQGAYNLLLVVSLAFIVLTQLTVRVQLLWRGQDLLPPLSDALVLFGLCYLSGGVQSPVINAYFLFIVVHAIGLHVRGTAVVAAIFSLSYGMLEVLAPRDASTPFELALISRQVLYLFWTSLTVGLLAGILRAANERASNAARENALLYDRAERTSSELRSVLNGTVNGMVVISPDLRIRFMNRQLNELLGTDLSNSVGRPLIPVFREQVSQNVKDPQAFEARLVELSQDLTHEAMDEVEIVRPLHRQLSIYTGPVRDEAGNLLGRIFVYHDVTEERAAERLKDEFLSLAAHELKTPLTSLKAYAQLLTRKPPQQLPDRLVREALATIDRQADRLTVLIDELLKVSSAETGSLRVSLQELNLSALVRETVRHISATTPDRHINVVESGPLPVLADPTRIEHVVLNLLTNAVKYSSNSTPIEVRTYREGSEAIAVVSDQGIGIPPDKLPHVFDRFYQAHSTERYGYGGMGIGLFISKEIVSRHGGRMWVESQEAEGSRFYFSLPLRR